MFYRVYILYIFYAPKNPNPALQPQKPQCYTCYTLTTVDLQEGTFGIVDSGRWTVDRSTSIGPTKNMAPRVMPHEDMLRWRPFPGHPDKAYANSHTCLPCLLHASMPCPCSIQSGTLARSRLQQSLEPSIPIPLNTLPIHSHTPRRPPRTHEPSNPSSGSTTPVPFSFEPEDPLTFFVSHLQRTKVVGAPVKTTTHALSLSLTSSRIRHIPCMGQLPWFEACPQRRKRAVTTLKSDAGAKSRAHIPHTHIWN